ncbi:MAG: YicC family protein [Deltaproteobacteria bacterium]|nr:YicC family protein [Deltaproteobacteria bacterium]
MIRSMTGFGRSAFNVGDRSFEIEARSVNHRHLDFRLRLPGVLQELEIAARGFCQELLVRGKVDINVSAVGQLAASSTLQIDSEMAAQYVEAARKLGKEHGIPSDMDVSRLLVLPGVARQVDATVSVEDAKDPLFSGLEAALFALFAMQEVEGQKLSEDFSASLTHLEELVDWLEGRSVEVFNSGREKLTQRMEQIQSETGLLDSARLHQEIVILGDRLDITEELVRLRSHIAQFRSVIDSSDSGEAVGRRLDFLIQEMGREVNTVGSKANDAPIAHQVVELKGRLEKIREQVQNIA